MLLESCPPLRLLPLQVRIHIFFANFCQFANIFRHVIGTNSSVGVVVTKKKPKGSWNIVSDEKEVQSTEGAT